jgi:enoyl-CoA hydratase/carnithine racemase
MTQNATIEVSRDGAVARLTFNRPAVLNALNAELLDAALDAARAIAESDARVLVLTGAGTRAFSAGVDLKAGQGFDREATKRFNDQARGLIHLLETMPQITIARVNGYCFTGGFEIALGCDFIIAADDAQFSDTHVKLGLTSPWGISQRLARLIGWMRAKELCVSARRVGAREALAIGLILDAVPAAELDARIDRLVAEISANNAGAVAAYKRQFRDAQNCFLDDGLKTVAAARISFADNSKPDAAITTVPVPGPGPGSSRSR